MNTQPEALLALADRIEEAQGKPIAIDPQAATELRRLHDENLRLRGIVPEALEKLNDELCDENDRLHALNQELLEALKLAEKHCPVDSHAEILTRAAIAKAEEKQ